MGHRIDIAWALEVPHAQLGARLEAYVETKSAAATLRACLPRLSLLSNFTIPPEVTEMIVDYMRDISYESRISEWHQGRRCAQDECTTLDHFTPNELANYDIEHPDDVDEVLWEDQMDRHEERAEVYLLKIRRLKSSELMGMFAKCRAIFANDFGITPCFEVLKTYETPYGAEAGFRSAEISGYLTQSITRVPMRSEPGEDRVSYSIQHSLDQRVLSQKMSILTKQQFMAAVKALRLEAAHTYINVEKATYDWESEVGLSVKDEINKSGEDSTSLEMNERDEDSAPLERDEKSASLEMDKSNDAPVPLETKESDEDPASLVSLSAEQQNSTKERNDVKVMSCECTLPIKHAWGLCVKYKTLCIDCDTEVCEGRFRASEPTLMLLGSGELSCYGD